jgi:hypothetical protein
MTMESLAALLRWPRVGLTHRALSGPLALTLFTGTLFLSALMLFSVQPMFAKMALPKLGGSPAVWAVSMCFFQAALLAGYCYAHALVRWLVPRDAVWVHGAVLAATCLALPIGLPSALSEPPVGQSYGWLLGVLALGVGLPFFAVAATAPLLQAWFARTGHKDADDPYFLYGASNFGSLIALLSYPVVIEPSLGLAAQSTTWGAGFLILAGLIACCGVLMLLASNANPGAAGRRETMTPSASHAASPGWSDRATWIALAALPSGMMVGITTYITTDIASAPFIWVIPLALFLATFILVFKETTVFEFGRVQRAMPATILVFVLASMVMPGSIPTLAAALAAFLLASLVCHRELYLARPAASHLTEFYIWMSAGGVLGGIFSALLAPQIFVVAIEFTFLLLLCLLVMPGVLLHRTDRLDPAWVTGAALGFGLLVIGYKTLVGAGYLEETMLTVSIFVLIFVAGIWVTRHRPEHRLITVLALVAAVVVKPGQNADIFVERSFFGTVRVAETPDGKHRLMMHGTTTHGAERIRTDSGTATEAPVPATYYHTGSPKERAIALMRARALTAGHPLRAGVVGLGAGSLACHAHAGETWRMFELDPLVVRVAENDKLFRFMSRCLPGNEVVVGDARLTLRGEPDGGMDLLVVDAFSSDAIPAHLLTREALEMYFAKVIEGGLIAIHVTNRHLDLGPSIAATAAALPGVRAIDVRSRPAAPGLDAASARVVFLTKHADLADRIAAWPDARPLVASGAEPWTDDYSDLLSAILHKLRG